MLYKTHLCKFYAKGTCKRGRKCSWAHGEADIRPFPVFFKTRMCYNWIYFRACDREPCTYAHAEEELRGSGKALRLCNYYFREGNCPKGGRCPMAHDVSQLDPVIRNNTQNSSESPSMTALNMKSHKKLQHIDCARRSVHSGGVMEGFPVHLPGLSGSETSIPSGGSPKSNVGLSSSCASEWVDTGDSVVAWTDGCSPVSSCTMQDEDGVSRSDPVDELWALLRQAASDEIQAQPTLMDIPEIRGSEGASQPQTGKGNLMAPATLSSIDVHLMPGGGPVPTTWNVDKCLTNSAAKYDQLPVFVCQKPNKASSPWCDEAAGQPEASDVMELTQYLMNRPLL